MDVDTTQTVAEIARRYPAATAVFDALGIDSCCMGNAALADVCEKKNISLNLVLSDLSSTLVTRPTETDGHWMTCPLAELSAYIVAQHHEHAKRELPRLMALAAKVQSRQSQLHPELNKIRELVDAMGSDMIVHMLKEEQVLFPRLKLVEESAQAGIAPQPAFFGALINPIRHMMSDHDDTSELLKSIRALANDYNLPDGACGSYQALYGGLEAMEKDTHQHIHLENDILFPRALEFEKAH
jgi:regulator of cell morphogenesis and NO signaling